MDEKPLDEINEINLPKPIRTSSTEDEELVIVETIESQKSASSPPPLHPQSPCSQFGEEFHSPSAEIRSLTEKFFAEQSDSPTEQSNSNLIDSIIKLNSDIESTIRRQSISARYLLKTQQQKQQQEQQSGSDRSDNENGGGNSPVSTSSASSSSNSSNNSSYLNSNTQNPNSNQFNHSNNLVGIIENFV